MKRDEWESMTGSVGWPKFRQFMRDWRADVMEKMARGTYRDAALIEAIIECQILRKLSELQLIEVQQFYGTDQPPPPEMQV